jgi:hypothetical protein
MTATLFRPPDEAEERAADPEGGCAACGDRLDAFRGALYRLAEEHGVEGLSAVYALGCRFQASSWCIPSDRPEWRPTFDEATRQSYRLVDLGLGTRGHGHAAGRPN